MIPVLIAVMLCVSPPVLAQPPLRPVVAVEVPQNPTVQARIQKMLAPDSAPQILEALARREAFRPMIQSRLAKAQLPAELEAVVFVESRYRNIRAERPAVGVGIWQFIEPTGQRYGLKIDATHDERLDPILSTDAALWLLADLYREFGDWGLAFAAYNVGSRAVWTAIEQQGTRDCWTLIDRRALPPYAADVMAAAALLRDADDR